MCSMKARVYVTLKKGILDPQGKVIQQSLQSLGHSRIKDVRAGKYFELDVADGPRQVVEDEIEQMCEQLLSNPVIETYHFEIIESEQTKTGKGS